MGHPPHPGPRGYAADPTPVRAAERGAVRQIPEVKGSQQTPSTLHRDAVRPCRCLGPEADRSHSKMIRELRLEGDMDSACTDPVCLPACSTAEFLHTALSSDSKGVGTATTDTDTHAVHAEAQASGFILSTEVRA